MAERVRVARLATSWSWTGPRVVTPDLYCVQFVYTLCTVDMLYITVHTSRLTAVVNGCRIPDLEREREAAVQESELAASRRLKRGC